MKVLLSGGVGHDPDGLYWAYLDHEGRRVYRGPYETLEQAEEALRLFARVYAQVTGNRCEARISRVGPPRDPRPS